jgi:hypothetical protein
MVGHLTLWCLSGQHSMKEKRIKRKRGRDIEREVKDLNRWKMKR